jgi:hypothetical protein
LLTHELPFIKLPVIPMATVEPRDKSPGTTASPSSSQLGQVGDWLQGGKRAWLVTLLTFLVGTAAGKSADAVWEKLNPPKVPPEMILARINQGIEATEQVEVLLNARFAAQDVEGTSDPIIRALVAYLSRNSDALAQLGIAGARSARGEEVDSLPQIAGVPRVSVGPRVEPMEEFATLLPTDTFVTGGVGGGQVIIRTPAYQAAELDPNLWVSVNDAPLMMEDPETRLRIVDWRPRTQDVVIALNERRFTMPLGSYIRIDHRRNDCTFTYVRGPTSDPTRPRSHGFATTCSASSPSAP